MVTRDYRAINAPFGAEYPCLRFLESVGYRVTYQTAWDTHQGLPYSALTHRAPTPEWDPISQPSGKLFLSVGHDEYWSGGQRAAVEEARDTRGVNLAFFSGNECFWKVRYEASQSGAGLEIPGAGRTMVCYKESLSTHKLDPSGEWTGTWRDGRAINEEGPKPENALTGTLYTVDTWANFPIVVRRDNALCRFWRDTAVARQGVIGKDSILLKGLIGHEFDMDLDNGFRPPGLFRLSETVLDNVVFLQDEGATFDSGSATHSLTTYRATSGALVFGAGTCQWAWGLDGHHDSPGGVPPHVANPYNTRVGVDISAPDPCVQQATLNLFADMGVQPARVPPGLTRAVPPRKGRGPRSWVESVKLANGKLRVTGGAEAGPGRCVAGVEVCHGGWRWRPATSLTHAGEDSTGWVWSYEMPWEGPELPDACESRAVDDCGCLGRGGELSSGAGGTGFG